MEDILFNLNKIRIEISFKTFDELRKILSFYQSNNLNKINIPCKNNLKKDFLLKSIKISKEEFPTIDIIPHFSILHEFKRNRNNTLNSFIYFLQFVKRLGCKEVLLISGSQKRSTLDSLSALNYIKDNSLFFNNNFSIGVAFNPYLSSLLFKEEIEKLENKLKSGIVKSIWFQFGTDIKLLESRIYLIKNIISSVKLKNNLNYSIKLYGSLLIPSRQFLSRFRYRPWKGVYCSEEFLQSIDYANDVVVDLLLTYKKYEIFPIVETDLSTSEKLYSLKSILQM